MPKKIKKLSDFLKKYYDNIESRTDEECWKDIEIGDYPMYQISNHGRVRNRDGLIINPFHSYRKDSDGNFIKERPTYLRVQIYYYDKGIRKKRHFEISRLVALHFIPIPKKYLDMGLTSNDLEVNHIRGGYEIYNNCVDNLEWCTTQENIEKSIETNLRHSPKGSNHFHTFFNESDVIMICKCIESNIPVNESYDILKNKLSVDIPYKKFKYTFYSIKYGASWVFISQHFNFNNK